MPYAALFKWAETGRIRERELFIAKIGLFIHQNISKEVHWNLETIN
jgi:hypothetical protein